MIYDELLKKRAENDRNVFSDSMSDAVKLMNSEDDVDRIHRNALIYATEWVLKYYGITCEAVPDIFDDPEDILVYRMRRNGVFYRKVRLMKNWRKNAGMVMIAFRKDQKGAVVLIPKFTGNYRIYSYSKGRMGGFVRDDIELEETAYVFYRPLPQRPIKNLDLLSFAVKETSLIDWILFAFAILGIPFAWWLSATLWQKMIFWQDVADERFHVMVNVLIFVVTFIVFLYSLYSMLMKSKIVERVSYALKMAFMERILTLPPVFFKEYDSARLATWIFEIDTLCRCVFSGGFLTVINILAAIEYLIFLSGFGRGMTVYLIIVLLFNILFFIISLVLRSKRAWPLAEISAEEYSFSNELLRGINKIKLRGARKRMFSNWSNRFQKKVYLKYELPMFLRIGTLPVLAVSVVFLFYYYHRADVSDVTAANIVAFTMLYALFTAIFMTLPKAASQVASAGAILKLIKPLMDSPVETGSKMGILKNVTGKISLKRVAYRYGNREHLVIDDMSLDIKAGEYVAITGRSGCGKSTLLRLLLGYVKPVSGGIYYDGIDLDTLDMTNLRSQMGCVLQDSTLFDGDIYTNLSVCAPGMTMDEAWEIAEIAGIADDIRQMPMGMHTMITGGGDCISGGQRQRLMIARAIASKPRILFFDEATSSLDNLTQKRVSDALDALKCTRVVIAHRLSTIKNCDRIIVMDGGRIGEEGTFEELMSKNGLFAELVRSQRL